MGVSTFSEGKFEAVGALLDIRAHSLDEDGDIVFSGGRKVVCFVIAGALLFSDMQGGYLRLLPGEVLVLDASNLHRLTSATKKTVLRLVTLELDAGDQPIETYARYISEDDKAGTLHRVASGDGAGTSARLAVAVDVFWATLEKWDTLIHTLMAGHTAVVRVLAGTLAVNDEQIGAGESAVLIETSDVRLSGVEKCELILIDTAAG